MTQPRRFALRFTRPAMMTLARIVAPVVPILVLLAQADLAGQKRSSDAIATQVKAFLSTLRPEQLKKATYSFSDGQRYDWHFIPQKVRMGLPIKEMTPAQREAAHKLLEAAVSARTVEKVDHIMRDLEVVLLQIEGVRTDGVIRDPERYFFTVFGAPGDRNGWGFRIEGHHVSLNFTYLNGELISWTPQFLGSYPAEVKDGPHKGLRVLAREMDLGLELLNSMDAEQRRATIYRPGIGALNGGAPGEIFTYNAVRVNPIYPDGYPAAKMRPEQKQLLRTLIEEYASRMPPEVALERMQRLDAAGFDKIGFAWAGQDKPGSPHYYKIQGPTFMIEYDNTQNDNNHIHTVWRDFHGDFGEDLLRRHYETVAHNR